jgi:hypothetical protein
MADIAQELRNDFPAVDVTTVVFSRDFAGVGCCVIPQGKVLEIIEELESLRAKLREAEESNGRTLQNNLAKDAEITRLHSDNDQLRDLVEEARKAIGTIEEIAGRPIHGTSLQTKANRFDNIKKVARRVLSSLPSTMCREG